MHLILQDLNKFKDWNEAVAYLHASPVHFLTVQEAPPPGLGTETLRKIIRLNGDYFYVPRGTEPSTLHWLCRILLAQRPKEKQPDLADFLQLFADRLIGKFDLRDVAKDLLAQTSALFDAEGSAILVFNEEKSALRFAALHTPTQEVANKLQGVCVPLGSGIAGWVANNRQPVLVEDTNTDPRFNAQVDIETSYETNTLIAAPIILGDDLIGVLEVVNRQGRSFSDWDLPTLSVVATVVAIFAEKANLNFQRTNYVKAAGKAEIASSVLHNIGNVLNSVNVSCSMVESNLEKSKLAQFQMANELLKDNLENLGRFFEEDPKGKLLPQFFIRLAQELKKENELLLEEVRKISDKTKTMRDIIETQQTIAKMGTIEIQDLIQVIDEALSIQREFLDRNNVQVIKNYRSGKPIRAQRAKLIHILINIIKNGIEAMFETSEGERQLLIESGEDEAGRIFCRISDVGIGMDRATLDRMFSHGFTTKKDGHGFGLASCAKAMEEMDGQILADSEGLGQGSSFTLFFPLVDRKTP